MPRPDDHLNMTQQEKYQTFKKAYDKLNFYIDSKEYLAAHALAFSILEDRVLAARIQCGEIAEGPINSKININKIPFEKSLRKILALGVIDSELHDELSSIGDERNNFLHQAMWRLDHFSLKSVTNIRKSINNIEKCRKKFIKNFYVTKKSILT